MITLKLNNLIFKGKHGVYEKEKRVPQRFRINVSIDLADDAPGKTGNLEDTIDWAPLRIKIKELIHGENLTLAEKVAYEIAGLVLADSKAKSVTVEVAKIDIWDGFKNGFPSAVVTKSR